MLFSRVHGDYDNSSLLETVTARQFVLGCVPLVNLFRRRAEPIRVTHQSSAYPLLVDARQAFGHEVYSIDKVWRVQQTPQGDSMVEFRPFYSLQHVDLADGAGRYWHAHRDDTLARLSPGHETELSIVDVDFDPAQPQADTLSVEVTATNRDLPSLLSIGHPAGDLGMEGGRVEIGRASCRERVL